MSDTIKYLITGFLLVATILSLASLKAFIIMVVILITLAKMYEVMEW